MTGLLVEPGDVNQLAAALRALTEDGPRLRQMGEEARRRVQDCLWPTVLEHHIALLRSVSGVGSLPTPQEGPRPAGAYV